MDLRILWSSWVYVQWECEPQQWACMFWMYAMCGLHKTCAFFYGKLGMTLKGACLRDCYYVLEDKVANNVASL